jgi:hypothetical protein
MKINRNNYPAYFLDYHEGRLSKEGETELFVFLGEHPELKEEFSSFENVILQSPSIELPGKPSLKKDTVTLQNWKTWLIAFSEGDLSAGKIQELELFLEANTGLVKEKERFAEIRLEPDREEIFSGKERLKKGRIRNINLFYYAAAAAIALLTLVYVQTPSWFSPGRKVAEQRNSRQTELLPEPAKETISRRASEGTEFAVNSSVNTEPNHETGAPQFNIIVKVVPEKETDFLKPSAEPRLFEINWTDSLPDISLAVNAIQENLNAEIPSTAFDFNAEEKKRFALHDILYIASKVIRKVSGRAVEVSREYDNTGEVIAYALNAGIFEISRPVK